MITQFQHLYFDNRMFGTTEAGGYFNPDFAAIAKAYGLLYKELTEEELEGIKIQGYNPILINYKVEGFTTVSPKLEYNKPIDMPSPQLSDSEYQKAFAGLN